MAVVPIMGTDSNASRVLDIAMINVSSVPFRYLAGADDRSWAELQIVLLANGSRITATRAPYLPLTNEQVRVLEPRGRFIQRVDLATQFGRLAPGEYAVSVSAHVSPALARDFGLTEVSLNQTIALLVIPDRSVRGGRKEGRGKEGDVKRDITGSVSTAPSSAPVR